MAHHLTLLIDLDDGVCIKAYLRPTPRGHGGGFASPYEDDEDKVGVYKHL